MSGILRHLQQIALALILILFLLLGMVYSIVVPIFEKPDELNHYFVVQHLLEHRSLPVQDGSGKALLAQEASQPPLYYVLAALATSWVDTSDARELVWLNPQRNLGDPGDPGNKNLTVHTDRERWPYRGTTLAIHIARWLSLLFGVDAVMVTYLIARQVFPARPVLALGAAAVNAFIPQVLFISSSVSNDSLMALLAALVLLILARLINREAKNKRMTDAKSEARSSRLSFDHLSLGFFLGLAALTKLSGLALLGLSGIVLAWIAWQRRSWRYLLTSGLLVGGLAMTLAGWWYVRNIRLYGDVTGLSAMLGVVGRRDGFAASLRSVWGEFAGIRASFWGLFGWFSLPLPELVYRVLDGLSMLATVGLAIWFLRQRKARGSESRRAELDLGLLLLWTAMVALLLVRWTSLTPGSQGRLLFPALPAIVLALVVGWSVWLPREWSAVLPLIAAAGLLVLSAAVPWWIIAPAYARPPLLSPDVLPSDLPRLEVTLGEAIRLHGCQTDRHRLLPGETLAVTCYWQALEPMKEDYYLFHHLLGRSGEPVGKEHGFPGSGSFPTSLWPVGQVVAAKEWVSVGEETAAPALGRLAVGVYDPDTEEHLRPTDPQGRPLGLIFAGQVKIAAPEPRAVEVPNRVHYSLGDIVALVGYAVEPTTPAPGKALQVTLYWEATAAPREDYTVFVHLLDESEALRGQGDGPPMHDDYPTSLWEPGEIIADQHIVAVHADAPAGRYRLAVGFYRLADGLRLPVKDADGVVQPDDRVLLPAEIRVE
jgi:4-amino-4-deoxy-L-arabinose transferase-like glycosyltransferase